MAPRTPPPPVICLMGPTAAGKTDLALWLHARGGVDLISVDSAMVYRGMDIGTAKPDAATQARSPHALIDIRDPAEPYSAAEFAHDAGQLIAQSHQTGRVPVLVGGTMLYFRALLEGLATLPAADRDYRAKLEAQAHTEGWVALHAQLARVDPATAARLHPNDAQRIQRALEVHYLTGEPMSVLKQRSATEPRAWSLVKFSIEPFDRERLHQRIEGRFKAMLTQGLVEEVRGLYERGDLHSDLPSMRSVGYRQVWDWLAGRIADDELVFRGVAATRQLARRQLTWLRRERGIARVDADDAAVQDRLRDLLAGVLD